jgi:signal transduction histidine kinase
LPNIKAHKSLISQLLQNLINNGLKYNQSIEPTIHISNRVIGGKTVYSVTDNGIGIPPQYQAQVFDMFRRLHSQAEYEGSGIGLAFCKRIVDTYGGEIWLESVENVGTTFFFTLPKAPVLGVSQALVTC